MAFRILTALLLVQLAFTGAGATAATGTACDGSNACTDLTTDICESGLCKRMDGKDCAGANSGNCVANSACGTGDLCACNTGYTALTSGATGTCGVTAGYIGGTCAQTSECTAQVTNSECNTSTSVCQCASGYTASGVTSCVSGAVGVVSSVVLLIAAVFVSTRV